MSAQSGANGAAVPQDRTEQDNRDLGFGSLVANRSSDRLLNRDGSFNMVRTGLSLLQEYSPYQAFLTMSWRRFFALITSVYLLVNLIFACVYWACGPNAFSAPEGLVGGHYLRCFFFSVQTLSTIGYGHIAPLSASANLAATAEAYMGLFGLSVVSGLVFARIARPSARVIFSSRAVVAPYRGISALMFRIANARAAQLLDVRAIVILSRLELEGTERVRRFHTLNLERTKITFFPLSWTIVHPIDETSPLNGWDERMLRDARTEVLVLLSGIDEIFSTTVYTRSSYIADEIVWGARFSSIYESDDSGDVFRADVSRIDLIEAAELRAT